MKDLIKQLFILFIVMASLAGIGSLGVWSVPVLILVIYFLIHTNKLEKKLKDNNINPDE